MTQAAAVTGVVIGAGAQGRVVLDAWRDAQPDRAFVFLDDNQALWGGEVSGAPVLGGSSGLNPAQGEAVLAIGSNPLRRELANRLHAAARWGCVVHPSASVSRTVTLGAGSVVLRGAVINTSAHVGEHVVVNSGVIVEHDCVLGPFSSICPGVRMGGRVVIGEGAFLATGVTVAPRVTVGAGTVVGAGSVVVRDLPAGVLAFGVPARVVTALSESFDWGRLL